MKQTDDIKELIAAVAKVQSKLEPARFNKFNPHYKNKYADFKSCVESCRHLLSENGIAVLQYSEYEGEKLNLVTMLAHLSGQWMKSSFPLIPSKMDSQGIGSAMTYAKRYALCGMLGIVADEEEDDDGEASVGRNTHDAPPIPKIKLSPDQINILRRKDEKLDDDTKAKLKGWLQKQFNANSFDEVLGMNFTAVNTKYENAVKYVEQQALEVAHA